MREIRSVLASQLAIVACPIAAATVTLLGVLSGTGIALGQILTVTIPATLGGIAIAAAVMSRYGKPLDQDPIYRERLDKGLVKDLDVGEPGPGGSGCVPHRRRGCGDPRHDT